MLYQLNLMIIIHEYMVFKLNLTIIINKFMVHQLNLIIIHFSLKHNVREFITGLFHECFIVYHCKKVEIDKSHIHQNQV
jgi:hypothetical protein